MQTLQHLDSPALRRTGFLPSRENAFVSWVSNKGSSPKLQSNRGAVVRVVAARAKKTSKPSVRGAAAKKDDMSSSAKVCTFWYMSSHDPRPSVPIKTTVFWLLMSIYLHSCVWVYTRCLQGPSYREASALRHRSVHERKTTKWFRDWHRANPKGYGGSFETRISNQFVRVDTLRCSSMFSTTTFCPWACRN